MSVIADTLVSTEYAGFWRRTAAYLLDAAIILAVAGILSKISPQLGSASGLLGWLYFALMESSDRQATLGKMALHLRVSDLDGNRISFLRATGRYFAKIISAIILLIGFMMAGWTAKKQALHDIIASTLVVKE